MNLQQILALKFLGFSLDEIKALLRASSGLHTLADVLAQQKAMMQAKRSQLDGIISAITQTERLLEAGQSDWDSLVTVIQAIRMEQNKAWAKKYFTPEQLDQMQSLSDQSYSAEAQAKIAARTPEWTEADQQRIAPLWEAVNQDITHLAAENADPAGPEAQDLSRALQQPHPRLHRRRPRDRPGPEQMVGKLQRPPRRPKALPIPLQQKPDGLAKQSPSDLPQLEQEISGA